MRQRLRLATLALALATSLGFKCEQRDPDPSLLEPAMGRLVVTAVAEDDTEITGVPVLIDGTREGRTPLSLMLSPGTYAVSVDSSGFVAAPGDTVVDVGVDESAEATFRLRVGFPRRVVIEEFTNSGCQGCPEFESLLGVVSTDVDDENLIVLSVHTSIPDTHDPMLTLELLRRSQLYYGISGNPSAAIDGMLMPGVPPAEEMVRDSIAAHRRTVSPVDLELTYSVAGTAVWAEVRVRSVADVTGDTRLLLMTAQTEIAYDAPPGSNGQAVFHHVVRDLAPDESNTPVGDPITITAGMDETRTLTANLFTQSVPPDEVDRLECVVVLQEWTTKTILQAVRATAAGRPARRSAKRRP